VLVSTVYLQLICPIISIIPPKNNKLLSWTNLRGLDLYLARAQNILKTPQHKLEIQYVVLEYWNVFGSYSVDTVSSNKITLKTNHNAVNALIAM